MLIDQLMYQNHPPLWLRVKRAVSWTPQVQQKNCRPFPSRQQFWWTSFSPRRGSQWTQQRHLEFSNVSSWWLFELGSPIWGQRWSWGRPCNYWCIIDHDLCPQMPPELQWPMQCGRASWKSWQYCILTIVSVSPFYLHAIYFEMILTCMYGIPIFK